MAAHAWLDSLSEDWVSQSGDASADKLPSLKNSSDTPESKTRQRPSRIPRRTPNSRLSISSIGESSPAAILSERSASDINVSNRRLNWRLCQQVKQRAASNSTEGSVVHNSVLRQSTGSRRKTETPEWKRRLVHGKVAYGEQRDLFCSAAEGLQDMFRPPSAGGDAGETTLPSSPPHGPSQPAVDQDIERYIDGADDSDGPADISPSPSPRRRERGIQYRLNEQDTTESPSLASRRVTSTAPVMQDDDDIYRDESCLTAPDDVGDMTRKTSGQTDTRNEDFSPILIGKHSADDGKVDFAPIDVPVEQLWQKLERLRVNQLLVDSQLDSQVDLRGEQDYGHETPALGDTTQDMGRKGAFINVQRGGRSGDGSFYHRGLSSELGVDTSEMLPEESLQASTPKQFPSVRVQGADPVPTFHISHSPTLPRAPFPSPEKRQARDATAASPLKLFGPYDTFTNQTLLRRISQFEEASGSPSRQSSASQRPSPPGEEDASPREARSISRFGDGDLDGYSFPGDLSYESSGDWEVADKENIAPASGPFALPSFPPPRESSPVNEADLQIRRRRNTGSTQASRHARSSSTGSNHQFPALPNGAPLSALTPKRDGDSEGKRPRTSPSKDPTPKRRRTLHRSDVAFGREEQLAAIEGAHQQMQAVMGKKRKDARSGEFQLADPSVLAMRSILWPRSPTTSPQASPPVNPQVRALQAAAAAAASPGSEHSETERKPSIRTQDFVDQAAQIMAMIRSQVRPELASLEESIAEGAAESPTAPLTDSTDESAEPFSRPPSRDGQPRSTLAQYQEDPELVSRLKKYQERSDAGDFISSSLRSMGLANSGSQNETERSQPKARLTHARHNGPLAVSGDFVSDLPNVRITSAGGQSHGFLSPSKEFPSNSSTRDFSRNFPTTSSRGSESRRTIMPESVSHLIPDRVGSMFLDKQNKTWIKRKGSTSTTPSVDAAPFEDSEEDPFASIPDLSVDMTKEMQNLRRGIAMRDSASEHGARQASPESPSDQGSRQSVKTYGTLSPRDPIGPHMSPLARGELERLEDRAASASFASHDLEEKDESVICSKGASTAAPKRRNLTISFSSPVASIIHDVVAEDLDSLEDDAHDAYDGPYLKQTVRNPASNVARGVSQGSSRPASHRGNGFVPRPVSRIDEQDEESTVEIHPEEDRQVSIIGDQSVVSHRTPRSRHTSLSFIINHTPGHGALQYQPDESAIIGRNVGKLSLSPLSEFTLNNPEQSFGFEVSYVMGHRHMATGDGSKRVLSMTIRELVDKLSQVEPYEPFWEDLTDLDLRDKQLTSLHMLDEFCGKVVKLDASQNKLNHLEGVPSSVRQLKASCNMLTELTSWDHLMHLQYVDISGNEVKSLSALKNLVHLRSVRADDNQLASLDGLDCHDGLLSLRARNNLIEELDCSVNLFERLTDLDLEGNMIRSIRDLELLPALSKLVLRKNSLSEFTLRRRMPTLRQLDVSDNALRTLDLSNMPNIQSVQADRNCIRELTGFDRARRLDSLSLREQQGDLSLDMSFLANAYEVRKLFLSGNYLGCFEPTVDFLNLQLLDVANCGLQTLPDKMGQLMPNLRTLNINFNAIADLSPLRYVPRLKKLLAAGNRLADSTAVTRLLVEFPHLTQLDVRDNPVTLGFYPPVQVLVPTESQSSCDPFTLPDADPERDELFASRLDEATRLRRRLHHIVLVSSCRRLRRLDGLPVRRREVLAEDDLLRMLIAEGLVPQTNNQPPPQPDAQPDAAATATSDGTGIGDNDNAAAAVAAAQLQEETDASRHKIESSRWSIENSFA
ncbi:conserved leucine-rich repeat protein [Purpureocillium lavendulum]|uniref:Conserved leucine-rich repeat protein n=1 Tax=Purpureocillium lavendulum TaxID=1247861 RepID=A0AB34FK00_9HYPO|nr:conserved leucine-rich repeat protein [Purpureocillium lavendulum]